jgi:hypothetical protein
MSTLPTKINISIQDPPQRFKVDDRVAITNPILVDRVGYPLSHNDAKDLVEREYEEPIRSLLEQTGLYKTSEYAIFTRQWPPCGKIGKSYSRLISALASMYLVVHGFGGKERKLYTHEEQDLLGLHFTVKDKRIAKTGTYYPSGSSDDGEDWYHGGLSNCKTHVLLCLGFRCIGSHDKNDFTDGIWIESKHVRKVNER